jgi:hypothetical protein
VGGLSRKELAEAKKSVAERVLMFLLAADRVALLAGEIGWPALVLLLALKAGPARPVEIAERLGCSPARARQLLLRARRRAATSPFVEIRRDGRYALTGKGHRFVNRVAGGAYMREVRNYRT